MAKKTTSLPILMYHYISRYPDSIAVSPELFAAHCAILSQNGWHGVSLAEAEAYLVHGEDLPPKSCLITFDDGYLDNYVYAWPILQEYGHKGTIFAVSSKIEHGTTLRHTLTDVRNNTVAESDLPRVDRPFIRHANGYEVRADLFCNWSEAREMEKSGTMTIAAHSFGHQGVFINDDYQGFFLPERQGRTFHNPDNFFWGLPKFIMGPGLLERAFLPSSELVEAIKAFVPQDEAGAFAFSQDPKAMQQLGILVAKNKPLGRMETDEETALRIHTEIKRGKDILEEQMGHPTTSLCWPWGAYSPLALEIGQQIGFKVFFTTKTGANPPASPLSVCRFKAKAKDATWLYNRVRLYGSPLLANLYTKLQLRTPTKTGKRKSFVIRQP